MLERLAAWFLNTYVADYVGNVDTDQLSIGLLKGAVELEKLPLKKDALRKLKLPFDIKSGYIGKLKLQIPIRYIKSQPWVIQIDQLYIVAGPAKPHVYNAKEEEETMEAKKQARLEKLEGQWKAEQQKAMASNWWWSPLSITFPSNVIANLQVIVNDVHIRYEDPEADPAHPFSIGMLLENLSAQSTDRYWEPKFTTGEDMAWKLVDLKNFVVYFDEELLGSLEGQSLTEAILKKRGEVSTGQQGPMTTSSMLGVVPPVECLIKPVSGQARLTRNCSTVPLKISDGPRLHLDIHLEAIPLSLSDHQYKLLLKLLSAFNLQARARRFKKWRPEVDSVIGNGRLWWKFALDAAMHRVHEKNRRYSIKFALHRAQQNVAYVKGYTRHLTEELLPEDVRQQLKEIEKEQSFEELAVLRTIVMNRIKKERKLAEAARKKISATTSNQGVLKSWFPGWISGGGGGTTDSETSSTCSDESQLSEEDQLLNELGYEAKNSVFLRDRIFLTLNFSLTGGSFQLVNTPSSIAESFFGPEPLVEVAFKSLCFSVDLRPRLRYGSLDLSLRSLSVIDHSHSDSLFPILVQTKVDEEPIDPLDLPRKESLFGFKIIAEEVNHQKLYQLKVHSKPLDIVYNPSTITRIKDFLMAPLTEQQLSVTRWEKQSQRHAYITFSDRLGGMLGGGAMTTAHRITSIKLDISAPHLILPKDFTGKETSVVILNLGHVTFGNVTDWSCAEPPLLDDTIDDDDDEFLTPPSSPPSEMELESTDGEAKPSAVEPEMLHAALHSISALKQLQLPHENYLLKLSDLQILVGKAEEHWRESVSNEKNTFHLLDKFTLSVKVQRTLKFSSEENVSPTLVLAADLPSLRFHIDEQKVHTLISCLQAIKTNSESIIQPTLPPEVTSSSSEPQGSGGQTSIGISMYHSAMDSLFGKDKEPIPEPNPEETLSHTSTSNDTKRRWRKSTQRSLPDLAHSLLVASEKQISAKLSITEVLVSLTSRGRIITELTVPGVNLEFLKRPHDLALLLLVQDLCLVDRIQTFGPEYELVVCSSGRSLLGFSPSVHSPGLTTPTSPSQKVSSPSSSTDAQPSSSDLPKNFSMTSVSAGLFDKAQSGDVESLLALSYTMVAPQSPRHPVMVEAEESGGGEGEGEREVGVNLENEAVIHSVSIQCTAVDAIANQETIIELIGFFQRAVPGNLLPQLSGQIRHLEDLNPLKDKKQKVPLQIEVNISFERLGVRMLRRVDAPPTKYFPRKEAQVQDATSPPVSRLIASIMLYKLMAKGKISTDISIEGKLEGVHVKDITPIGKKYSDILIIGMEEEKNMLQPLHCLSFSINRSPQSQVSLSGVPNPNYSDVHLSAFVPAIHYLHSVNFVYEMEMFVSEFLKYFSAMVKTFKSAAVGMAKGFVRRESQLAKGLSMLHSSFGHTRGNPNSVLFDTIVEETDTAVPFEKGHGSKLYYEISIQSPVIAIPSSLSRDDCLVAHLGKITMKNEYLSSETAEKVQPLTSSSLPPAPPSIERMVLNINDISLHAAHTKESRLNLESFRPGQAYPEQCSKVLREISMVFQIDKQLNYQNFKSPTESCDGSGSLDTLCDEADVVITGRVCNPLLIKLPKGIFDQINATIKYGIRRKPKRRFRSYNTLPSPESVQESSLKHSEKMVHFDSTVRFSKKSPKRFPKIYASFSLPKLSLELKHVIDLQDRDLVYISLDDLSAQYHQTNINFLSLDLSLKSIVIEDLLQPKDSEYRNILASSSKPLPFPLSPVQSSSTRILRNLSSTNLTSSLSHHFFPLSHLMSTPKPPSRCSNHSPLRSFNSSSDLEGSFTAHDDSKSTLKGENSHLSEGHTDLLTIKAFYVNKEHPLFEEKYSATSLHANVDFSSVFVIINLQTWVLLLDYLGIGIPTPPPSRPVTPDPEHVPTGSQNPPRDEEASFKASGESSDNPLRSLIDNSLMNDARDLLSLGSDKENSLYVSMPQILEENHMETTASEDKITSDLSNVQLAYSMTSTLSEDNSLKDSTVWGVDGKMSVCVKLNVNSLTVTFNKPEHPLARGSVSGVTAEVKLKQGNMEISGALGQGSVVDMTETGAYYRERFTTTGERALTFQIFKYGRPDPLMKRPFDVQAKVQMTSVRYLHTMRFLKEILAFVSHFPQLIDAFQRMKAIAQGNLVYNGPERKARISFDVNIDGPILLIPMHAFSQDLMVGDIGHLTVSNSFCYDGQEGTISHMRQQKGMDHLETITGTASPLNTPALRIKKLSPQASTLSSISTDTISSPKSSTQSPQPFQSGWFPSPCSLSHDDLENYSRNRSDNSIFGGLECSESRSSVDEDRKRVEKLLEIFKGPCLLDCIEVSLTEVDVFSAKRVPAHGEDFKIVRQNGNVLKEKGAAKLFIERNLYEDFCRDVPDFHIEGTLEAIHVMLDKSQLELIKGLVEMNLGEPIEDFEKPSTVIRDPIAQPMAADVWTGFLFRMQFMGVQMEFFRSRQTEIQGSVTQSLARFDIQESEFTFESRSNQRKTVDLTSNAVIGYDTRYEGYAERDKPSIFEEVLRPRSSRSKSEKKVLQVEIHVLLSPSEIKASILLNNLRLVGIFDLILELKSFIFDKWENDIGEDDELDGPRAYTRVPELTGSLRKQLASNLHPKKPEEEKKNPRRVSVKLSMTETDFVVVEDMTSLGSNAVVLKGTLILKFLSIPDREKLLHCSLDGLELFSCSLSNEDETALSILDPVTIGLEIKPPETIDRVLGITDPKIVHSQVLEIEVQQLNFRLSYNDIKLFLAIAQSLPNLERQESRENGEDFIKAKQKEVDEMLVKRLLPLGFTRADIRKELYLSDGNPDQAASKLLAQQEQSERASSSLGDEETDEGGVGEEAQKSGEQEKKPFAIRSVVIHADAISICLIDDCVDHDVPLLDFSLADLQAEHNLLDMKKGQARAVFAGDYYNRHISAWEPVLEPWICELAWTTLRKYSTDLDSNDSSDRTRLTLSSKEQLNINITSSLLHILRITQASWSKDLQQNRHASSRGLSTSAQMTSDFLQTHRRTPSGKVLFEDREGGGEGGEDKKVSTMEKGLALLHSVRFVSQTRQRNRFVPFLLRNNTGLPLKFATLTSVPSKVYVSPLALYRKTKIGMGGRGGVVGKTSEWMDVSPGREQPFDFSTKGKMRHRNTRELVVHQLLVKIAGWQSIDIPVSVDKIGVFFREVWPSSDTDLDLIPQLPMNRGPVRLVFAISLNDVKKIVNIRSALVLKNTMEIPLEVKLEPNPEQSPEFDSSNQEFMSNLSKFGSKSVNLPILAAKSYLAIPIHLTSWNILVRPQHWGVQYCSKHLAWKHVMGSVPTSHARSCHMIGEEAEGEAPPFRFCVSVCRENYPINSSTSSSSSPHPAHTLTLFPPLTITNRLPCDFQFSLAHSRTDLRGTRQHRMVPKGGDIAVYSVNTLYPVEFDVALENFERCQGCIISLEKVGIPQSMVLEDYKGHPLRLNVNTEMIGGSAIKVSISCTFWLINRTGLPLVFRQEGMTTEAAGQLEEHERASTATPLLFSYSEGEFVEKCSMRLGRGYRYLTGKPLWCAPFRMISDNGVCRVFVRSKDDRPDQEFQVGVDIQRGSGRFRFTKIVTFVARYQLENRTQYKLAYLQRHQLVDEEGLEMSRKIPVIAPGALMPFHWPRTDLDQLLCLRVIDIQDSIWSGGFILDKDSSFHLNIRSTYSYSAFVHCQITLKGATYHVIFSDASRYPPPFRLENLSQTPITCCQNGVKSSLTIPLNPGQSVPYSWDEHTLPECLRVAVKGGGDLKVNLEKFGPKGKVYYESYFYIVAYSTFSTHESMSHDSPFASAHQRKKVNTELVLDVPQGTAVIFQKKDVEKRTQLWRMSASRQLVHIASSSAGTNHVLDIAGGRLPGVGMFEPLVLRKSLSSRAQSQTWRFSEDGRLLLGQSQVLCVQSRSGYEALREGADAVLGHVTGGRGSSSVPREQDIRRMKHSPGSGVLSVSVVPDGPTRILRVVDENKKYSHTSPRDDWIIVENGQMAPSKTSDVDNCQDSCWDSDEGVNTPPMEIEVALVLHEGVGVSLINAVPEELIYASLRGIKVEFISSRDCQSLNATIQDIQVDNKLAACHTPVLAYPTPPPSGEADSSCPILKLYVEKIPYKSPFAIVFKVAELLIQDMTVILEERLLFKLLQWAGVGLQVSQQRSTNEADEIKDLLSYRAVVPKGSKTDSLQLYFERLNIATTEFRVNVSTTSQLPEDLKRIKYRLGFPLIKFESPVKLTGFKQSHMLGDISAYSDCLMKHYTGVIKAQAINILGSVDFLGNPMGLFSDVASGVSGMISVQPDVVGLVRDVAHGMSDTTSKLTGTVSHVLGKATFDPSYQEEREQMLESCQTSGDHLKAGLMGLSSGVFGGMTSIVTQPIKDAKSYGFGGIFTGLAKGVVSTIAKPVAGLFDLASETSAAIRETTSRVSRLQLPPVRHTRCCVGANGALTPFSISQARGQEYLLRLTDGKVTEKLVSYELLYETQAGNEKMRVIISSQYLYFFQQSPPDPNSLDNKISLDELAECKPATAKSSIPTVYIVLSLIDKQSSYNAPKYKCFDEKTAKKVAQLINYAKNLHEEEKHVVRTFRLQEESILW